MPSNAVAETDERPYSPGLEGVLAGETSIAIDGANGRLMYRGYPIGELVRHGTYAQVAELLWTGEWPETPHCRRRPLPEPVLTALRACRRDQAMDALRTAVSAWGADESARWPPTVEQARALTAPRHPRSPRSPAPPGQGAVEPDPALTWSRASSTS